MARKALNAAGDFVGRHAALAWTIVAALAVALLWEVRWWHPACATSDWMTGYAIGFPLPYAQPTLVSSGEYMFMPHVLLLNLLLLGGMLFPLFLLAARWLGPRTRAAAGVVAWLAALPVAALWAMVLLGLFMPTLSIADPTLDGPLLRYRPAFVAEARGQPPCD